MRPIISKDHFRALIAASALVGGCGEPGSHHYSAGGESPLFDFAFDPFGRQEPLPPWDEERPFLSIEPGHIVGRFAADDVDLASDHVDLWDDGGSTTATVYALRDDGRRFMMSLSTFTPQVPSGEAPPARFLRPGLHHRFPGFASDFARQIVYPLTCAGPDGLTSSDGYGAFAFTDYDETPCSVDVTTAQTGAEGQDLALALRFNFADEDGCAPVDDEGEKLPEGDLPVDGEGDGRPIDPESGGQATIYTLRR